MKFREEYKRILSLIILFIIFAVITLGIKYYFRPFFIVLVFIIATTPVYKLLSSINIEKHIASFLSLLIVNLVFIGIVVYFGNYILEMLYEIINTNEELINYILGTLKNMLDLKMGNIMDSFNKIGGSSIIKDSALMTGDSFMSYFVANVVTFFFLVDKSVFKAFATRIIPKEIIDGFSMKKRNLKSMLIVQGNLILVSMLIMSFGFTILRVDRPIFLAVFGAIIDILPYVGTIIVFIPIIIYNIIMKNYFMALGFVILYVILVVVKEILEAKFLSSKLELHPLIVFLSIYVGLNIFGILGMLIGPIYCMLAKDIIYKT